MPEEWELWARPIADAPTDHVYHRVTFGPGPNIHEVTSACGIVARFWPRIGIRMGDRHCEACLREGEACLREGEACLREALACLREALACLREGEACLREAEACLREALD